jgi:hypothetical protein
VPFKTSTARECDTMGIFVLKPTKFPIFCVQIYQFIFLSLNLSKYSDLV